MNNVPENHPIALTLTPDSSQLHGYGYDAATQILVVEFATSHENATYFYLDVPPAIASGLDAAKSKGVYVNRTVRPHFNCSRQDKPPRKEVKTA